MKTLMIIGTAHGGMFFALTYLAAFLVAAGMMIRQGFRKGYPTGAWLLIILSGVIFFIIGDKVFTYSPEQWKQVFTGLRLPAADKKSVLGGITGLFAGIFLAKTILKFNRPVLDNLAIALPVAMAISRTGCLMAGCCFGTPSNLPWAIRYGTASAAFQAHLAKGLIHPDDLSSLAVHPVQAYQVIGCLIIAFIVWRSRRQWKSSGDLFLFSVLCYAVLRFFVEFVRAPESNFFTGRFLWGLKIIQWLILGVLLPGIAILITRELKVKTISGVFRQVHVSYLRQVLLAILLSILVYSGRNWFDPLELTTIVLFLIPVIVFTAARIYLRYSVAGFRWVIPVLMIGCFSFMAQKSNPPAKESDNITFTSIGLTGMVGSYYEQLGRISKEWIPPDCGSGGYWSTSMNPIGTSERTFYQGGIDLSHNKWVGKYYKYSIGATGFLGFEAGSTVAHYPSGTSFGFSPYITFDWRWVGFGGGLSLGQMKLPLGHNDISGYDDGAVISDEYKNFFILPSVSFRIGPSDLVFAEMHAPALFPSSSPLFGARAGIGSGLGKTNGTKAGIGFCQGIYAQVAWPVKNKVVLEAYYGDNLKTGSGSKRVCSFGIHYRFSFRNTTTDTSKYHPEVNSISPRGFSKLLNTVMDYDGNIYHTLALGGQVWMAENLRVTHFGDGSAITSVTNLSPGAGYQYNWFAVSDKKALCPAGWHVPSLPEWTSLVNSLGGEDVAGAKLKGSFSPGEKVSQWWSSTEPDTLNAQSLYLDNRTVGILYASATKSTGLSVRCMRDY